MRTKTVVLICLYGRLANDLSPWDNIFLMFFCTWNLSIDNTIQYKCQDATLQSLLSLYSKTVSHKLSYSTSINPNLRQIFIIGLWPWNDDDSSYHNVLHIIMYVWCPLASSLDQKFTWLSEISHEEISFGHKQIQSYSLGRLGHTQKAKNINPS